MIKSIKVKCIKSTGGAFMKGQIYNATFDCKGDEGFDCDGWVVEGVEGYGYETKRGMWGTIFYSSADRKERFTFEPVEGN